MKNLVTRAFICWLLACVLAGAALAHPKISKDLELADPTKPVDVIVQFRPGLGGIKTLLNGVTSLVKELPLIGAVVVRILPPQALELAGDPDIEYVSLDRRVAAKLDYAGPAINSNLAFNSGITGQGITVAVIDSGIDNHGDLRGTLGLLSRVVYQESFVPGDLRVEDGYGHGTHVAGIVAGDGTKSTGSNFKVTFRGVAPAAKLMNLRVLDQEGRGSDSAVIAAIQRAILLKILYNVRVINLSLGRPVWESHTKDPLCRAVEAAWNAGIFVVVSAGNEGRNNSAGTNGYGTIGSPGNSPYAITVGAMKTMYTAGRSDDLIASYSSKGPTAFDHFVKPDIVAPGNQIVSLMTSSALASSAAANGNRLPLSYYQKISWPNQYSQDYFRLSGTSMAAPMVSGAAALLLDKDPSLSPDQLKARLMKTASKTFPTLSVTTDPTTGRTYVSHYDIFTVGAGYLDVWAALSNRDLASGAAMSPSAVPDAATGTVKLSKSQTAVWGDTGPFGLTAVWGSTTFVKGGSAVWGDSAVWGSTAVWGDRTSGGYTAVWGDTAVWGATGLDGDTAVWGANTLIAGER